MTEMVIALLMIINGEIKDTEYKLMSQCLNCKRVATRTASPSTEYQCIKSMAETEIYMGEKSIKN